MRDYVVLYINGQRDIIKGNTAFLSLAEYLRDHKKLRGTKIVCKEGDCGSCTVLRGRLKNNKIFYETINSCIAFLYALDCTSIVTIEGLSDGRVLTEIQRSLIENHGSQCGYCTPGFVMSLTYMFEQKESVNEQMIKDYTTGNLCRCTGYKAIMEGALKVDQNKINKIADLFNDQEMILDFKTQKEIPVSIKVDDKLFQAPCTLTDALDAKYRDPEAVIFGAGTDLGVAINKKLFRQTKILSLNLIDELYKLEACGSHIDVGAKVSITDFQHCIKEKIPVFSEFLHFFASPQIKNTATLVGNIMNASPVGDSIPSLLVLDSQLLILSNQGEERKVNLKDFYFDYKKMDLNNRELVVSVRIPFLKSSEVLKIYKVSRRKTLDISSVSGAFLFDIKDEKIIKARIAYGGIYVYPLRIYELERILAGKPFVKETFLNAANQVSQYIKPISDHRGSDIYRRIVAKNLLLKAYFDIQKDRN